MNCSSPELFVISKWFSRMRCDETQQQNTESRYAKPWTSYSRLLRPSMMSPKLDIWALIWQDYIKNHTTERIYYLSWCKIIQMAIHIWQSKEVNFEYWWVQQLFSGTANMTFFLRLPIATAIPRRNSYSIFFALRIALVTFPDTAHPMALSTIQISTIKIYLN